MSIILEVIHFILLLFGGIGCVILLSDVIDNQLKDLLDVPDED